MSPHHPCTTTIIILECTLLVFIPTDIFTLLNIQFLSLFSPLWHRMASIFHWPYDRIYVFFFIEYKMHPVKYTKCTNVK